MLEELKQLKTWVVHKNKQPYSVLTGRPTGVDDKHSGEWVTYDEARAYLDKIKIKKESSAKESAEEVKKESAGESKESEPTMAAASSADNAGRSDSSSAGSRADNSRTDNSSDDFNGLGFVIPKGYFFLDIDHNDATSPLAKEIMALLPTYAEISQSGTGVHLYGKCDFTRLPTHVINSNNGKTPKTKLASRYYVKNASAGLELYIGDLTERFSTFTELAISKAEDAVDCTQELLTFLNKYMLRKKGNQTTKIVGNNSSNVGNNATSDNDVSWNSEAANETYNWNWPGKTGRASATDSSADWSDDKENDQEEPNSNVIELSVWKLIPDKERYITLEEADIPTVIADLQKQANAEKFKALYEQGEQSIINSGKSHSEADASLCSMIASRVGPNSPGIIDAIFRKSAFIP